MIVPDIDAFILFSSRRSTSLLKQTTSLLTIIWRRCTIYLDVRSAPSPPPEYFLDQIIIASRNNDVDDRGNKLLGMMSGEEQIFYSRGYRGPGDGLATEPGVDTLSFEFLRSLTAPGLPRVNYD